MKSFTLKYSSHLAFGAAALVIVALGWMRYHSSTQSRASAHWVSHTREVLRSAAVVNETLGRSVFANRGYAPTQAIRKRETSNGGRRVPFIACTGIALGGETQICFATALVDPAVLAAHTRGDEEMAVVAEKEEI